MIKEFGFTRANTKSGYKFNPVELLLCEEMASPILNNIHLFNYNKFLLSELKNISGDKVNIKIKGKTADILPVYIYSDFMVVSKRFKDIFNGKLNGKWLNTNNDEYYIFLLDNLIDALDKNQSTILYSNEKRHIDMPWTYKYIENENFISDINDEYLFTIPECTGTIFCTDKFQNDLKINNITGYQLYKDLNFTRKDGFPFDWLRQGKYDIDGNCIK